MGKEVRGTLLPWLPVLWLGRWTRKGWKVRERKGRIESGELGNRQDNEFG